MNVQVATEGNFRAWQGFDLALWEPPDEDDVAAPKLMRFLKSTTLAEFSRQVAEDLSIEPDLVRPWVIVNRQNGTKRPDQPLDYPNMTLEEASAKFATRQSYFKVFIEETTRDAEKQPVWPSEATTNAPLDKKTIIVFLKYFDPYTQQLKGAGHAYMNTADRVQDLATPILDLMQWQPGTNLKLFEEIKPNFVEVMKPKQTLNQSEIQDGDIICFQKALTEDEAQEILQKSPSSYLEAPAFYDYLLNRISVHFEAKPGVTQNVNIDPPENSKFSLYLSRKDTYDNLALKVAEHLSNISDRQLDETHLRFTTINASNSKPRSVVKRLANATLANILNGVGSGGYGGYGYANQSPDSLYYEVLEMSLSDLEQRKSIKVTWLSEGITKEVSLG